MTGTLIIPSIDQLGLQTKSLVALAEAISFIHPGKALELANTIPIPHLRARVLAALAGGFTSVVPDLCEKNRTQLKMAMLHGLRSGRWAESLPVLRTLDPEAVLAAADAYIKIHRNGYPAS